MLLPLLVVFGIVLVGVVGSLAAMAGQLHERRKWERRLLERAGMMGDPDITAPGDRMARVEQVLDVMAIELERVGEGQRFLTKVLATSPRDVASVPRSRSPQPGSLTAECSG